MEFEKVLENVLQTLGFNHWLYFLAISSVQIFGNPHITAMAFLGKTPGFSCNTDKDKKLDPCKSQCDKFVFEKNYTSISTEVGCIIASHSVKPRVCCVMYDE